MSREDDMIDPFIGLPAADGPSLFADDDAAVESGISEQGDDEDDNNDAAGDDGAAAATAAAAAVAPSAPTPNAGNEAGATDEAHLPPWMRSAHASIIHPATPSPASLGLDARLLASLKRMGVRKAFPVQATVIPVVLAAHAARGAGDVCVCAPTGSGKTLAYALPVVQSLLPRVVPRLRALVLLPTRGLAAQVRDVFAALCEGTRVRVGLAAGHEGVSFERERASLLTAPRRPAAFFPPDDKRSSSSSSSATSSITGGAASAAIGGSGVGSAVDILVATPGRLVEHLQHAEGGFDLQHLRWLVVDEADRLLAHGFQDWLSRVLEATHATPATATPPPGPPGRGGGAAGAAGGGGGLGGGGALLLDPLTRRPRLGSAAAVARGPPLATALADPPLLKLLFSATLTRSAAKLAPLRLLRPRYFCVAGARYATPTTLREWMMTCRQKEEKPKLLLLVLRQLLGHEAGDAGGTAGARAVGAGSEDGEDDDDDDDEEEVEDEDEEAEAERQALKLVAEVQADAEGEEDEAEKEEEEEDGDEDEDVSADDDDDEDDEAAAGARASKRRRTTALADGQATAAGAASSGSSRSARNEKVIIFASSLESTHRLTRLLQLLMPPTEEVCEFSSSVPPKERTRILKRFQQGTGANGGLRVLVTSDAMARGMDVEGVTAVINYDPPANIKGYVHRVGRTARAGKRGVSYTMLHTAEVHHFKSSMAKAGKEWRPLTLAEQYSKLDGLAQEYQRALDRLGAGLEAERAGTLQPTAPRDALEKVLENLAS